MIESFAQAENETRSDNIRMGLNFRAAQGTSGLYRRRLYGYDKTAEGELVINKEQAQVVRDIFRWYIDGKSVLGIIKELEKKDIWKDIIEVQSSNTPKVIESKKEQGGVCNAQI